MVWYYYQFQQIRIISENLCRGSRAQYVCLSSFVYLTLTVISGKAKAIYAYESGNSDELTFAEGDILSIVDMSEEEWWKAEQGGVVLIAPAAYLEVVEG